MSLRLIILFYVAAFTGSLAKNIRIAGGHNSDITRHPYQVSIRILYVNLHICGGVIISRYHILSAAHCFTAFINSYDDLRIYIGTNSPFDTSGTELNIFSVNIHPLFNELLTDNEAWIHDIAIVTVDERIRFIPVHKRIDLPTQDIVVNSEALIIGYGKKEMDDIQPPDVLQESLVFIMDPRMCSELLERRIHPTQGCTFYGAGVGSCHGDSGGPVIVDGKLVGIQSWVIPCAQGYPDVFTNVYSHLEFINRIIGTASSSTS